MRRLVAACCLAVLCAAPAAAQEMTEAEYLAALEESLPGTLVNNPLNVQWRTHGANGASKVVQAQDAPGGRAYQVRVKAKGPNPWSVAAHGPVQGGVAEGDTVLVAFWARAARPDPEIGAGGVQARLQQNASPYAGVAEGELVLNERWQIHYVSGVAPRAYEPGQMVMSFNVGHLRQTVELGQYFVMNLGKGVDPATLPRGSEDAQ